MGAFFYIKGHIMTKFYIPIAICAAIIGIYLIGFARGRDKCIKQIAEQTASVTQQQNIKKEKINVEIYRTNVRDIRDILRMQYTIAD